MAAKPWYDSSDLVNAVQRKISLPLSQNTFEIDDILAFANEEMSISQVPAVLSYHEEFFVTSLITPLVANQSRYPVPDRAIGMRLRDLFYVDTNGNVAEMTRISQDDQTLYQNSNSPGGNGYYSKYYIEGNDIVLVPAVQAGTVGSLKFTYYLRPNQLVQTDRASTITSFIETIQLVNASLVDGDTVTFTSSPLGTVTFTAKTSGAAALEFNIGATSILSATNLVTSMTNDGTFTGTNLGSDTITITSTDRNLTLTTSSAGFVVSGEDQTIRFDTVPTIFSANDLMDFLQTKPGHKTRAFDVSLVSISGNDMVFEDSTVPTDLIVNDYVCLANECIIPQIPCDLHTGLAEKTCSRILSSIGDMQGLNATNEKLKEIRVSEGTLLNNRVEGSPQKINSNKSLLRFQKIGTRRRF